MKIWSNTNTLAGRVDDLDFTDSLEDAEAALIGGKPIDIEKMPKLRGIFKCGIGTDNVPFEAAEKRAIKIAIPSKATQKFIFEETANFACHLILKMLYRQVGDWDSWKKESRDALQNQTLLLIGAGNIGQIVHKKMAPFLQVITYDTLNNAPKDLEPMIQTADVISLHIPLNDATLGFMDSEKLNWMKTGAALVNTARGPIVNEEDLGNALASGKIAAAFDVFWKEPYTGPLSQYIGKNFFVSPHVASTCADFTKGTANDFRNFLSEL